MEEKTIFHVHSYRCKHASQEQEEEYIKKGIAGICNGIARVKRKICWDP